MVLGGTADIYRRFTPCGTQVFLVGERNMARRFLMAEVEVALCLS